MAQGSRIAESFLDGIGCLGAVFEPAVRPGSQVNLIQSEPGAASEELSEIKERMSALEGIVARLRKENEELNSLLGKASSQVNQRALRGKAANARSTGGQTPLETSSESGALQPGSRPLARAGSDGILRLN